MSEPTKNDGCLDILLTAAIFTFIGLSLGFCMEDHFVRAPMRAKAVDLGVAEWKVDPKTGDSTFTWKESKP